MVDINKLKKSILASYPLFGKVITNIEFRENNEIETACTDGKVIYYNEKFLEPLSDNEKKFVLLHEISHIAFRHIERSKGKNQEVWNIACDAVVNALLKKDGLPLVKGGIDKEDAIDYNAEEYYEKLLKEEKNKEKKNKNSDCTNNQGNGNNTCSNTQGQNDNKNENKDDKDRSNNDKKFNTTHDMWDKNIKKSNSKFESLKDKLFGKKEQPDLDKIDEKDTFSKNREEKIERLKELRENLENIKSDDFSKSCSNLPRKSINTDELGEKSNVLDWKRYLINESYRNHDWSYENATIEFGVVTPHLEELPHGDTEIVLDTSMSVSDDLIRKFLRECKNIFKDSEIKVGCFDTKFYGFKKIRSDKDIDDFEIDGRGGTDFDVAVGAFSRNAANKIVFTDGESYEPEKRVNAIWIVYGDCEINPPGGKVFYVDPDTLKTININKTFNKRR